MNFVKDIKKIDNTKIYLNIDYIVIKNTLNIICMWYNILCL